MKVSSRQLNTLIEILEARKKDEYCYLEMLYYLVGDLILNFMKQFKIKYRVPRKKAIKRTEKFDLDPYFKDYIELKYKPLQDMVREISGGSMMIRDQMLIRIIVSSGISVSDKDISDLEKFLRDFRDAELKEINFKMFLYFFEIDSKPSETLSKLLDNCQRKHINLKEENTKKKLSCADLEELMNRC
jgi:hypothetical protein